LDALLRGPQMANKVTDQVVPVNIRHCFAVQIAGLHEIVVGVGILLARGFADDIEGWIT